MRKVYRSICVLLLGAFGIPAGLSVAKGQDWQRELEFVARQQQLYLLKFADRPDATRFQIVRMPTAKWPKRDNFYVKVGETTADGQVRIDSFKERQAQSPNGIMVDASEIEITSLKDGQKHSLVRNIEYRIPTYFAELRDMSDPDKKLYVKEGDDFLLAKHPGVTFRLAKVGEQSVAIEVLKDGEKIADLEADKK